MLINLVRCTDKRTDGQIEKPKWLEKLTEDRQTEILTIYNGNYFINLSGHTDK
jgi:hypothetical protein